MNPLSPQNKHNFAFGWICLVSCLLCCACMPEQIPQTGDFKAEPTRQNTLAQYGFQASGFTPEQEKTLEKTLAAFGRALGGPEKLRQIIITFNHGEIRPILYDPQKIGAGSWIVLGPTSFSMELANRSNLSCYGAETDEQHTMIVLGHELSHLLVLTAERQTGGELVRGLPAACGARLGPPGGSPGSRRGGGYPAQPEGAADGVYIFIERRYS
ncbi:MAG: hypothetical protein IH586_12435 [Anaerolineaceae bacterium]|nr:hypothetical protein [Anaerolineaceae bacterium]